MSNNVNDLKTMLTTNIGPDARIELLTKAAEAYDNGKVDVSIFYQVQSLFNAVQDRYFRMSNMLHKAELKYGTEFMKLPTQMNCNGVEDQSEDILYEYAMERLKLASEKNSKIDEFEKYTMGVNPNFLQQSSNPEMGFEMIIKTCKDFPKEWTIVQVCKGPRPQTTYSIYEQNAQRDGDIYLTLLKHARSSEYPEPICLRFSEITQVKLFDDFYKIANECKEYMGVDGKKVVTHEAKLKYFEKLNKLDKDIKDSIAALKQYLFPWHCLFRGVPNDNVAGCSDYMKKCYATVDEFCSTFKWKQRERILLSIAALYIAELTKEEIEAICEDLTKNEDARIAAKQVLKYLQGINPLSSTKVSEQEIPYKVSHFPCILIVDEHIDHFFWEELHTAQEMCRVNSLHCLQKLYTTHKAQIRKGYLCLDIKSGSCVINPDNNLPKTQMRLESFFNYWTPTWVKKIGEKPLEEELFDEYFKRGCYVYAGHGSGLQFFSGKNISKRKIDAVVFLFGCDSTRMHSSGLYSDLVGPHIYYHAAHCPCLVGSILPALDAQMDGVAVELLSRWVASPDTKNFITWKNIDLKLWTKKGIIQPTSTNTKPTKNDLIKYQMGSLCGAVARIHMRCNDRYYYNTVPYVCRGLPVWNCNVQPLP